MSTLPNISGTDPSRCIFDSFRAAIARQVADALPPLTPEQVYAGVDYGRKGEDFTIAIPRFRLPGKPDDLGKKVVENVSGLVRSTRPSSVRTVHSAIPPRYA
jgi:arginyl-tRNA synthetase